jgi:hypothetical protein
VHAHAQAKLVWMIHRVWDDDALQIIILNMIEVADLKPEFD